MPSKQKAHGFRKLFKTFQAISLFHPITETYSEPWQISTTELYAEIVKDWKQLPIFVN